MNDESDRPLQVFANRSLPGSGERGKGTTSEGLVRNKEGDFVIDI